MIAAVFMAAAFYARHKIIDRLLALSRHIKIIIITLSSGTL